jgi:hypothetical protein
MRETRTFDMTMDELHALALKYDFERGSAPVVSVEPRELPGRAEAIARMEASGDLDPECRMCREEVYARIDTMPGDVFMPRHKASVRCRSGRRSHCTCDTCF